MTTASPSTILIVEDHIETATALQSVVKLVFDSATIVIAASLSDGLDRIREQSFDLALVDLGLPDGSGIDLIKVLSSTQNTFIVVTTIFDDDEHLFQSLQSGASGYLLKGHQQGELVSFLRGILTGSPPLSPTIAHAMLAHFRNQPASKATVPVALPPVSLTNRESEVLQLIAKGCQVSEVATLLEIAEGTVSAHVKKIYEKLDVHNRAEATIAAIGLNLVTP